MSTSEDNARSVLLERVDGGRLDGTLADALVMRTVISVISSASVSKSRPMMSWWSIVSKLNVASR